MLRTAAQLHQLVAKIHSIDGRSADEKSETVAFARRLTLTEEQFFLRALTKRYIRVFRSGWPDFFLEDTVAGKVMGVEVKAHWGDRLSPAQREMFAALERWGMPIYVWTPRTHALVPWKKFGLPYKRATRPPRKPRNP